MPQAAKASGRSRRGRASIHRRPSPAAASTSVRATGSSTCSTRRREKNSGSSTRATPSPRRRPSPGDASYPPFSVWSQDAVDAAAKPALHTAPDTTVPLGLYLHIPFCRKRCHFCYFRVYTDKNAQEVGQYLDVLAREWELYGSLPAVAGRPLNFVYFGGGTPSFLSTAQLQGLVKRLTKVATWNQAEEITFECEPGTLTERKLSAIRRMGVTRLSLGV